MNKELMVALTESVKLQSHYAKLLNMYDGGERRIFKSADEWVNRLRDIGEVAKPEDIVKLEEEK